MHSSTIKYITAACAVSNPALVRNVNLELLVGQLLAAIGDVAAAVGWLHFTDCDGAIVCSASDKEGLALGSLAGRHGVGWNVTSFHGDPLSASGAENLVFVVAVFATSPGNVCNAMGRMQLSGNQVAFMTSTCDVQLFAAVEATLHCIGWYFAVGCCDPATGSTSSRRRETQDGCRWRCVC